MLASLAERPTIRRGLRTARKEYSYIDLHCDIRQAYQSKWSKNRGRSNTLPAQIGHSLVGVFFQSDTNEGHGLVVPRASSVIFTLSLYGNSAYNR